MSGSYFDHSSYIRLATWGLGDEYFMYGERAWLEKNNLYSMQWWCRLILTEYYWKI